MSISGFWHRLNQRPDTEHQAAIIRIVIAVAASMYMLVAMRMGRLTHVEPWKVVALIAFSGVYAVGVLVHILARPQICIPRRVFCIALDLGATTFTLFLLGEAGLPFIGMLMFCPIGNGFRFGTRYLYLACLIGVLGFTVVMFKSNYWASHLTLDVGILIAMLVVPMYVASLIRHLHAALARLRTMATHDPLTSLPNRQGFYETVDHTLALSKRNGSCFAIIFVDLDGFKPVNDSLGHAAGDEMLRMVAQRLRDHVRKDDVVARIGGDEFVIVMPDVKQTAIRAVIDQVIHAIALPYTLSGRSITLTTSVGIAFYPESAHTVDELVAKADSAMYQSKRLGGDRFCMAGDASASSMISRPAPFS